MDVTITNDEGNWCFTSFYGYHERSIYRLSWDLLRSLAGVIALHFTVMGDYNNLLSQDYKRGGVVYPNWLYWGF